MTSSASAVFQMPRDLGAIAAVAVSTRRLASDHLGADAAAEVELALVEALTNAVKHGEFHDRDHPNITITVEKLDDRLVVKVADSTPLIPEDQMQDLGEHRLEFDPDNLDTLLENGRGLSLIVLSMDDVSLHSSDDEFTMSMTKIRR